jgi:hypothetical protein
MQPVSALDNRWVLLGQKGGRRFGYGLDPNFEVDMVTHSPPASSYRGNCLSLFDPLIALHEIALVMGIDGHNI